MNLKTKHLKKNADISKWQRLNLKFAHSKKGADISEWQLLIVHLLNVAHLASRFAKKIGGSEYAYYIGLMHDLGKYFKDFQIKRLILNLKIDIDHMTAGGWILYNSFKSKGMEQIGFILYSISMGHHGGLKNFDTIQINPKLEEIPDSFFEKMHYNPNELGILNKTFPLKIIHSSRERQALAGFLFTKMLFSCLVDADYLDTEKFMSPERYASRQYNYSNLFTIKNRLGKYIKNLQKSSTRNKINNIRTEIYTQCLSKAKERKGIFLLTISVGGGKTLTSTAFSLDHACYHNMDRIIYTAPLTSIIEQNSKVLREACGENNVIEHHSNVDSAKQEEHEILSAENWDAPIIVTTHVQLFESLFSCSTSRSRKLHNICNSVIILDEVQEIPVHYLKPILYAIQELVDNYNCTVILCTATQPAFLYRKDFPIGFKDVIELAKNPQALLKKMKRVQYNYVGELTDPQIISRLTKHKNGVCVVNTRSHARELYDLAKKTHKSFYHLSASMCSKHRSKIISKIKKMLLDGQQCYLIATKVIESGVNIDFIYGLRALCGLSSHIQTGGRVNRNGLYPIANVDIFEPSGKTNEFFLNEEKRITREILKNIQGTESQLDDISNILKYFEDLFWRKGNVWKELLEPKKDELDRRTMTKIQEGMLSNFRFRYKDISDSFKIVYSDYKTIIIPYDKEAIATINELRNFEYPSRKTMRDLQKYSVQVRMNEKDSEFYDKNNMLEIIDGKYTEIFVLREEKMKEFYTEEAGLLPIEKETMF